MNLPNLEITMKHNSIYDNIGYGIAIEKSPNLYKSDVFYGTNIKTENIVMQNNSLGEIGKIIFDQDY